MLDAQGNVGDALQNYQDSLVIADRLAKLDPANSDWQRDLSITLSEIGMLETKQRHFEGSKKAFEASLAIRQKLAQSDPNNAIWQFDLVQAYINYAYVAKDPRAVLTKALNLTLELDRAGRLAPRDKSTIKYLRGLLAKFGARKK